MKKRLLAAVFAVMFAVFCVFPTAYADESFMLDVGIVPEADVCYVGDEVTFNVKIRNVSDKTLTDIKAQVSGSDTSYSAADSLEAGETCECVLTVRAQESDVGEEYPFEISVTAAELDEWLTINSKPDVLPGKSDDIVILYTNDIHCGIDTNIGYDGLALYKREMEAQYKNVLLVDSGDAIQGAPIGTISKGAYITRLMNTVGYDAVAVGNHEFDYGIPELIKRSEELNCGYVCVNFINTETGERVFDAYRMIECGDKKIAFVGITTPETFSKTTPVLFQNDKGEYIYSFGEDGTICELVQEAIDDARDEGADYVILLAHLGENGVPHNWSAPEIAAGLRDFDAVIDAHSHEVTPALTATTGDGKKVVITQTGTKLANIGKMTISADGSISTELIDNVPAPDDDLGIAEDTWFEADGREGRFVDEAVNMEMMLIEEEYDDDLDTVIGHTDFDLIDKDPESGERLIRKCETNLGDLCADAYKYVLDAEVAILNGGGIRAAINAGDITYLDIISVSPFGNMMCTAEVSGQQILDVLEVGAMNYPEENGSFLQVSGIEYKINASVPSPVKLNEKGEFLGADGEYRVYDVLINGEPLDTKKTYVIASHDYYLKNGGDGYIFSGKCRILKDAVMTDNDILIAYIRDTLGGVVPEKYSELYGSGRIGIVDKPENTGADDVTEEAGISVTASEDTADDTEIITGSDVSAETAENPATGSELPILTTAVLFVFAAAFAGRSNNK